MSAVTIGVERFERVKNAVLVGLRKLCEVAPRMRGEPDGQTSAAGVNLRAGRDTRQPR